MGFLRNHLRGRRNVEPPLSPDIRVIVEELKNNPVYKAYEAELSKFHENIQDPRTAGLLNMDSGMDLLGSAGASLLSGEVQRMRDGGEFMTPQKRFEARIKKMAAQPENSHWPRDTRVIIDALHAEALKASGRYLSGR